MPLTRHADGLDKRRRQAQVHGDASGRLAHRAEVIVEGVRRGGEAELLEGVSPNGHGRPPPVRRQGCHQRYVLDGSSDHRAEPVQEGLPLGTLEPRMRGARTQGDQELVQRPGVVAVPVEWWVEEGAEARAGSDDDPWCKVLQRRLGQEQDTGSQWGHVQYGVSCRRVPALLVVETITRRQDDDVAGAERIARHRLERGAVGGEPADVTAFERGTRLADGHIDRLACHHSRNETNTVGGPVGPPHQRHVPTAFESVVEQLDGSFAWRWRRGLGPLPEVGRQQLSDTLWRVLGGTEKR